MGKIVKYNMKLEVLSPVHIAGAEYKSKLDKKEYVFDKKNKVLYIIDNVKFVNLLIKENLFNKYITYIEEKVNDKVQTQKRFISLTKFLEENKLANKIEEIMKKKYSNISSEIESMNDIKLLNRDINNKPILQGSSIKGALINLLLIDYIINNRKEFEINKKEIMSIIYDKNIKDKLKEKINSLQESILYNKVEFIKETKRIGISISDTYKYENTRTNFYRDIDEKIKDKKEQPMPIYREYISPKSKFYFDITIDFDLFSKTKLSYIKNMDDLISALERAADYLIKHTLNAKTNIMEQNLILGANTGFHQKTIIHALFENKKERVEIVKRILHKGKFGVLNHINDKEFSPRIINRIKINNNLELAGLVKIRKIGEKNVGTN